MEDTNTPKVLGLVGHVLSWADMLKLAHSMMRGLSFLHDEVIVADGHKYTLAHRDIKSKNILIKQNMTAAIADFGLAQVFSHGSVNESSVQVGISLSQNKNTLKGKSHNMLSWLQEINIHGATLCLATFASLVVCERKALYLSLFYTLSSLIPSCRSNSLIPGIGALITNFGLMQTM